MLLQALKITLVFVILYVTISFYKFTQLQLDKQKRKIEKFNASTGEGTDVLPAPKMENMNMYYNIIGVFKFHLDKPPTSEELTRCMELIQREDLTIPKLHDLLSKNKADYDVVLFPELKNVDIVEPTVDEVKNVAEEVAEVIMSPTEHPIEMKDGPTNVKYILNRPTIYNIASNHPFMGMGDNGNPTQTIIDSVKRTVAEMDDAIDRNVYDEEAYLTFNDVEKQKHANRCTSKSDMDAINALAGLREDRNLAELDYACNRSTKKNHVKNAFDVHNFNFDTKHPKIKAVQTDGMVGTPIDESKKTQIGSIMPRFKYQEGTRR